MSNDKDVVTEGTLKSILKEMMDQKLPIVHEIRKEVEKVKLHVKEQSYKIDEHTI